MLPAPAAHAIPMTFGGILSGANEGPPNNSPGAGTAVVVLDPTAETIQIIAGFFGLTAPDTAAHIHCCGPLGTNVGVATTVPAFAGFPLGVTQGTYLSQLFSLEDAAFYNPTFVTMQGGLRAGRGGAVFSSPVPPWTSEHFQGPWSFDETPQGYRVLDAKGRVLAYVVARDPSAMSLRASMFC
jgi:hypothetical protein